MSKRDWFRKTTWTAAGREDFCHHLNRCRPRKRAQYLRIQAYHLQQTGERSNLRVALELLEQLEREFPDSVELNLGLCQKAECHDTLGEIALAVQAFRASFIAIRKHPTVRPMTQFVFGRFVIERNLSEYFDEALKMLEEFTEEADFIFPAHRYSYFAICAVIAGKRDQGELARECTQRALAAAEQKQSGIKYHPKVGLVNKPPTSIHTELERLAM